MRPQAFFLEAPGGRASGQRFCLYHAPTSSCPPGLILYVPPFAEEMNKSRRMAALQARAFAGAGYGVLQVDLNGCGDSSGDFGDATWQGWIDDVVSACAWLRRQGDAPLWLWGLRAGSLLAARAAAQLDEACSFLFWQPATSGKAVLQQFLRLKLAAGVGQGSAAGAMRSLREQLSSGRAAEVAGYCLSPSLADALEQAVLRPPPRVRTLRWLEVSNREDENISPLAERCFLEWRQAGADAVRRVVPGPAFWQTTEIEEAPALVAASLAAMENLQALAA